MSIDYDTYLYRSADEFFNSPSLEELEEKRDDLENRMFDEWHENWHLRETEHELRCEFYDENY